MRRLMLAAGCAVLLAGESCVPPASGGATATRDIIEKAEIDAVAAATAYDLVSRLRPEWLRGSAARSGSSSAVTLVYMDNIRVGTIDALRTIAASGINSITRYDAVRAATVFPDAARQAIHGAISIRTRP